jgi:AhpD family alkylhydroperoxidase
MNTAALLHQTKSTKKKRATHWEAPVDLDESLLDLVRLRVVQIHDCPSCMQEHTRELKARGETDLRLRHLKNWRNEAVFSDREEAALNLAEAMTYQPIDSVPTEDLHVARLFFNESEMICLTLVILAVNDWHYLNPTSVPIEKRTTTLVQK